MLGVAAAVVSLGAPTGSDAGLSAKSAGVRRFTAPRGEPTGLGATVSSPPELVAEVLKEALESLVRGDLGPLHAPGVENQLMGALELRGWGDTQARARAALLMLEEIKGVYGKGRSAPKVSALNEVQRRAIAAVASRLAKRLVNNEGDGEAKPGNIEDLKVPIPTGYSRVHWQVLGGFRYSVHEPLPAEVTRWDAKQVALVGYMLPVAQTRGAKSFLLVESLWGCCFGAVPDMNQVIDVHVSGSEGVDYRSDPVMVSGVLEVGEKLEEGAVVSVFRLQRASVVTLSAD